MNGPLASVPIVEPLLERLIGQPLRGGLAGGSQIGKH